MYLGVFSRWLKFLICLAVALFVRSWMTPSQFTNTCDIFLCFFWGTVPQKMSLIVLTPKRTVLGLNHVICAINLFVNIGRTVWDRHWNEKQVVKVIWHKTASRSQTNGSIAFARWRQYALPCYYYYYYYLGHLWSARSPRGHKCAMSAEMAVC